MSGGFVVGNPSQIDPKTDPKIAILGVSGGPGGVPGGPGASRSVLGGSWGRLGGSRGRLGASGDRLGGVLGPSWGVPGPSLGGLGPSWGGLGRLLGPSWGVRGRPGGVLGASWGRLGASRGRLERHLLASFSELVLGAVLGPIFYPFWTSFGAKLERKNHQKPWRVVQNQGFRGFASDPILGPVWEPFRRHFRPENRSKIDPRRGLGASWGRLGASWGRLGPSWVALGAFLGRLGGVLGRLGWSRRVPEPPQERLGASWRVWKPSGPNLGPQWGGAPNPGRRGSDEAPRPRFWPLRARISSPRSSETLGQGCRSAGGSPL